MVPQFVLLETPPEFYYLEEMFDRHRYPRGYAEKMMKTILFLMRTQKNVHAEVPGWIERFRYSESEVGELLYRPLESLGQSFYQHFTKWGMYLPDGQMPYAYSRQDRDCTLFTYDPAYHALRPRWQFQNTER